MNADGKRRLVRAPSAALVDVQSLHSAAAVAHEAQRALSHLEQLADSRRSTGISSAAEVYQVLGEGTRIARKLDASLSGLRRWMREEVRHNRLVAETGPFAGEPEAAVAVTEQALGNARAACFELAQALERAQLATAHLAAPASKRPARDYSTAAVPRWRRWPSRPR